MNPIIDNVIKLCIGGPAAIGGLMYGAKGSLFLGNLVGRTIEHITHSNEKTKRMSEFFRNHDWNYFRDSGDAKTLATLTLKCIVAASLFTGVALLAFGKFDVINRISQLRTLIWNSPLCSLLNR